MKLSVQINTFLPDRTTTIGYEKLRDGTFDITRVEGTNLLAFKPQCLRAGDVIYLNIPELKELLRIFGA